MLQEARFHSWKQVFIWNPTVQLSSVQLSSIVQFQQLYKSILVPQQKQLEKQPADRKTAPITLILPHETHIETENALF